MTKLLDESNACYLLLWIQIESEGLEVSPCKQTELLHILPLFENAVPEIRKKYMNRSFVISYLLIKRSLVKKLHVH